MNKFDTLFNEYKLMLESPENFNGEGELLVDSGDVVTFIYFVNKNSIIMGEVGYFISHSDLMKVVKSGKEHDNVIIKGDMEVSDISIDNTVMGRFWKKHNKVSIWDYMDNNFGHLDLKRIFKNISKLTKTNFMKYVLEITPVSGMNVHQDDSNIIKISKI